PSPLEGGANPGESGPRVIHGVGARIGAGKTLT
ncbi:MAG: hypothetical protein RIQ93_554, partial [Verrucomicrobiota bacterium]